MALLSDLTREQNRTKAMAFIGVSFGITFAIAMVLGPIVTHSLGLNALFWMIAALATLGILLTIWVVPNSTNHVLNRESGDGSKAASVKCWRSRGCSSSISALCVCIFY
ncbi:major facilitator family transport protein [Salmonella enterica subsp. enterica]|uniref:Major facilitator family transport protein n=1 Tax=Salmonella enterica I TaxID=59201 RepID=A0A447U8U2_SALET|nr:major facilitator family transport protein [Salmonella enterica subsp. enterica]